MPTDFLNCRGGLRAACLLLLAAGPAACAAGGQAGSFAAPPPVVEAAAPITPQEFAARRAALIAEMGDATLLVVGETSAGAPHVDFVQSPALRYLTGVVEPGAALVLHRRGDRVTERLFVLPRDPANELWDGLRLGAEGATTLTGLPALPRESLPLTLDSLLSEGGLLLLAGAPPSPEVGLLADLTLDQQVARRLLQRHPELRIGSAGPLLDRQRAAKSEAELDRLRRASYITMLAHREAMRAAEPGMNEFELHALIEYTFRRHGAERAGFPSIVGSGPNSTTLHYRANDRFIEPGDMIVMDIGASYDGYTADITRTIPASGTFTSDQRDVYSVVLEAQKAAEALVRAGATWQALNAAATGVIESGLARLGLIDGVGATFDGEQGSIPQVRLFYMHGLGHGIGLQVHDPEVSYFGGFATGSAFTIEPGIYVRADALDHLPDTPANRAMVERLRPTVERYAGIGVRIEDDYVVTDTGVERISRGAPREIEEVEALMRESAVTGRDRRSEIVDWYRTLRGR